MASISTRPRMPENITPTEYFTTLLKDRVNLADEPKISSLTAVIRFEMTDGDGGTWDVVVEKGLVKDILRNSKETPTCTFKLSSAVLVDIIKRKITPQNAFFQRKVDIDGDMFIALKMNVLVTFM